MSGQLSRELIRFSLTNNRRWITDVLRRYYHRLPLPLAAKRFISRFYHGFLPAIVRRVHRGGSAPVNFQAPAIKPRAQQPGVPDYVVWGVIDWHFRHQRPQQLALSLAASGRRVFYISSALSDQGLSGFECEALNESRGLFQIKLFASGGPSIYSTLPGEELITQLRGGVGEMLLWAGSRNLVSLIQHPFWTNVATVLPNSRVVYDCMDHHEGFGNTAPELVALERALLSSAHLTVTTSAWLEKLVSGRAQRHAVIRNACEYDHFAAGHPAPYRDSDGRKVIGYYGAIAEWFDLDLLEAVANRFETCCVLLVGADTVDARKRLSSCRNVLLTGEVIYSDLPYYVHGFDVCILPFKVLPLTLATNPVKVYEFLSAGKPVVSVDLPEIHQFEDLVSIGPDISSFLAAVERALRAPTSPGEVSRRQEFARGQTWEHRTRALAEIAESPAQDPTVSVIVVTYNNIDLTKACLESLDDYSDYERMELIVVDNASSDGSVDYLKEWVGQGANRRLIANAGNRGFAAANNQGLAVATGDYVALLNNDTYVTPGWVRTLMGHLRRDATIGLIGPVTNNIGNEARIPIVYSDMTEMREAAARHTAMHIGRVFGTRTVAFFCVMMARTVYERVGPLDEAFGVGFFEDDDYCRRVEQLGLRIGCAEDVFIHHVLSAAFDTLKLGERRAQFDKNKEIYEEKWGKWVPHSYRTRDGKDR